MVGLFQKDLENNEIQWLERDTGSCKGTFPRHLPLHVLPKRTIFLENILTFLDVPTYRHMHAYVKTNYSTGVLTFDIRRTEKGYELAEDCEGKQKLCMKYEHIIYQNDLKITFPSLISHNIGLRQTT